jgi:hypothetical protein
MKTITQDFLDTQNKTSPACTRRVYFKRRYWVESSKSYVWEGSWTEIPGDMVQSVSAINWQLDTQNLNEFKLSNVTLTLDNLHNEWKADNPYGHFGGDSASPRGYESFWMKFKVAAGMNYLDDTEELLTLFTGLATEYTQDSHSGAMQISLHGLEALLENADAERVSTTVTEETVGTGDGVTKDFTTAHTGVGLIDLVSVAGATKKAGVDFTLSQFNDTTVGGKVSFIAAPASGTIRVSYRYWKVNQLFEDLVKNLLTEAGIASINQLVNPVLFPNKIINKHLFDTQTEWVAGTKTAIDTDTLVDSIKIDFGDSTLARTSTTYGTATTGWTTYGSSQVTSNAYDSTAEFNAGTKTAIDTATANTIKPDYASSSLASGLTDWADSTSGWSVIGNSIAESGGYLSVPGGPGGSATGLAYRASTRMAGRWQITTKIKANSLYTYWIPMAQSSGGSINFPSLDASTDTVGLWGGYGIRIAPESGGSTCTVRLLRMNSSGSNTTLASATFSGDTSDHSYTFTRSPVGGMVVYRDGTPIAAATDNTFTSSNFFGLLASGDALCKSGTLYVPPSSMIATWVSTTLDLTAAPYGWQAFARAEAPNSGTIAYYTRTSDDDITYDAWAAVTSDTVNSAFRRYIQVRVDMTVSLTTAQNPMVTSVTIGGNISSDWTAPSSKLTYTPATADTSGWVFRNLFKGSGRWDCSIKESADTSATTTWFHFMFQSIGTLGVQNFFNGYSVKVLWSGSSGTLKFIRNDSSTIGTEVELASTSIARDATVSHAVEIVRFPSGRFLVYFDATLKIDVTDLTFTTGNYIGFHIDASNLNTVRFGDSTLYVPADSITASWQSAAIDESSTPDAWSPIEYAQILNGGSTAFYTKSSSDNITYEAYQAVPSSLAIPSTLNRYIKLRVDLTADTTANQDPTLSAYGSGSVTTSTRITLANFTGLSCYAAIQELATFANYEWGFTPDENFFFRSKIVSTTPVMDLDQKNFLMQLKSVNNGFSRIFSTIRASYGSYQTDVSDDALNYLGPIARFGRQRLEIDGGDLLISADADVATGVAGAFFNYYKSARRRFKVESKFIPQLDLSDTIRASFLDNYPSKLWSLGDTTVYLGELDINLFGSPEQTLADTLCKVVGMRIDTEAWTTELDLEEVLV